MTQFTWKRLMQRGGPKPATIEPFTRGEGGFGLAINGHNYVPSGCPTKQMEDALALAKAIIGCFAPLCVEEILKSSAPALDSARSIHRFSRMILGYGGQPKSVETLTGEMRLEYDPDQGIAILKHVAKDGRVLEFAIEPQELPDLSAMAQNLADKIG
jgi:hypothetical protein